MYRCKGHVPITPNLMHSTTRCSLLQPWHTPPHCRALLTRPQCSHTAEVLHTTVPQENAIQTTEGCYPTPIRVGTIKKPENNKCW